MSTEALIALIVVAGLVFVVALIKGRGMKVKKGDIEVEINEPTGQAAEAAPGTTVNVANNAKITNSKVGNITGAETTISGAGAVSDKNVNVANDTEIGDSEVGDIIGVKISDDPDKEKA